MGETAHFSIYRKKTFSEPGKNISRENIYYLFKKEYKLYYSTNTLNGIDCVVFVKNHQYWRNIYSKVINRTPKNEDLWINNKITYMYEHSQKWLPTAKRNLEYI